MKKFDFILIGCLILLAIMLYLIFYLLNYNTSDKSAVVMYNNELILTIDLSTAKYKIHNDDYIISIDEDSNIFVVSGTLGPVTMLVENNSINVIDQTSPKNICQLQGATSSRLKPLACLPNNIVIIIEDNIKSDVSPDTVVG